MHSRINVNAAITFAAKAVAYHAETFRIRLTRNNQAKGVLGEPGILYLRNNLLSHPGVIRTSTMPTANTLV